MGRETGTGPRCSTCEGLARTVSRTARVNADLDNRHMRSYRPPAFTPYAARDRLDDAALDEAAGIQNALRKLGYPLLAGAVLPTLPAKRRWLRWRNFWVRWGWITLVVSAAYLSLAPERGQPPRPIPDVYAAAIVTALTLTLSARHRYAPMPTRQILLSLVGPPIFFAGVTLFSNWQRGDVTRGFPGAATLAVASLICAGAALGGWTILGHYAKAAARSITSAPQLGAAMPAMLAVVFLAFLTQDAWTVLARISWPRFGAALGLLIAASATAVCAHALREAKTSIGHRYPLRRREHANVMGLLGLLGVARLISAGIGLCLVLTVLGVGLMDERDIRDWGGPTTVWTLGDLSVAPSLVRVAALLGALAALYFSTVSLQKADVRKGFFGRDVVDLAEAADLRHRLQVLRTTSGASIARAVAPRDVV